MQRNFHLGSLKHPNTTTLYPLYTSLCTGELDAIRKHKCFLCSPFYGRACRWAMLGELKPKGPAQLDTRVVSVRRWGWGVWIMGCGLWVVGCGLGVGGWGLVVEGG